MQYSEDFKIDEKTINQLGLQPSDNPVNTQVTIPARVFKYPDLENVFIMESDLYGNEMPEGSIFLAYYGRNGLMGQQLKLDLLKNASVEDIRKIVESNSNG